MAWGAPSTAKNWADLNRREWATLIPLAALVLYLGFAPGLALRTIEPSLARLLAGVNKPQAAERLTTQAAPPAPRPASPIVAEVN